MCEGGREGRRQAEGKWIMQWGLTDALASTLFFWRTNRLRRVPGDGANPMLRSVFMSEWPAHFDII